MNRRQAYKLIGSAFSVPFSVSILNRHVGALLPANKGPVLLSKDMWADKEFQIVFRGLIHASLGNIGIPESRVSIGFPLSQVREPTSRISMSLEEFGLGSDNINELPGTMNSPALVEFMTKDIVKSQLLQDPEVQNQLLENAIAVQKSLEEMRDPNRFGVLLGLVLFSLLYILLYDSDLDGVPNSENLDEASTITTETSEVMLPDLDGDGIPEDFPLGPVVYLRDCLEVLGVGSSTLEGASLQLSFTATGESLIVDGAVTVDGETTSLQAALEA